MSSADPITIVGAGLTGAMAALLLGQKGEKIRLIESRPDFRATSAAGEFDAVTGRLTNVTKRSINLALSFRGISALKSAGSAVFDRLSPHLIPMRGRFIHPPSCRSPNDKLTFQPYGTGDQAIYSVSRNGLNAVLLDEVDRLSNVESIYSCKVLGLKKDGTIETEKGELKSKFVLGADGAFSKIRTAMSRHVRQNNSFQYIEHGYKELTIPPLNGQYAFPDWQGLHIWPRGQFMLIALPNPDFSFTATLFAPFEGPDGLDSLTTPESIMAYFQRYFPDVIPVVPNLIQEVLESPSSALVTLRCSPWNMGSKALLLGDAAHATVPFYGQGMNAGFEDCLLLKELYEQYNGNPDQFIPEFARQRTEAGFALVELSMENYIEMRDHTGSTAFLMKKRLESMLHWAMPNYWIPKYTMVAFTRIPYHEAKQRAERQERILHAAFEGIRLGALIGSIWGVSQLIAGNPKASDTIKSWGNKLGLNLK